MIEQIVTSPFIGISEVGGLVFLLTATYLMYTFFNKLAKLFEMYYAREIKYEIIEDVYLHEIASERGIDIDKELIKRDIVEKKSKNIRKQLEKKVMKKFMDKFEVKDDDKSNND